MKYLKTTVSINQNYKGFFFQVLLVIFKAKNTGTFIIVGQCGHTNDSAIFKNSKRGKCLESYSLNILLEDITNIPYFRDGKSFLFPYYMVGYEIFQAIDFLISSYSRIRSVKRPTGQDAFNYQLRRARHVIENCFGVLTARSRRDRVMRNQAIILTPNKVQFRGKILTNDNFPFGKVKSYCTA